MKKHDIILIIALLVLAAAVFFMRNRSEGDTVVIYLNDEIYDSAPLDSEQRIDIEGKNTVCVKNGAVFMEKADCPDKICVAHAPISTSGDDIVCLPNKVVVKIISSDKNSPDTVTR